MSSHSHHSDEEHERKWIDKIMFEMKEKNAKYMQRHEVVKRDRLEAERLNSAVTVGAGRVLPVRTEAHSPRHAEKRLEREWDVGKSSDCDWDTEKQDMKRSRLPKNPGYSSGKKGYKWRNWDEKDQREEQTSGNIKRHGNSRVYTRNQDAIKNNSYTSPSYSKSKKGPEESMNKNSQGWNNGSSVRPSSNRHPSSYCDNSAIMATDDDVIWHNDKLNEDKNKMGRTETWVLDQRRNWYDNKNKGESDRKTYSKNKVSNFNNSYDPHHEIHTRDKNHRSSTSDSNYKENGRGTSSERSKQRVSKDTYPSKNRHERSSSNFKDTYYSNHSRFNNPKYNNRCSENVNERTGPQGNVNRSWNNTYENKQFQKLKVSSGVWSDEEGNENKQHSKNKVSSGTWSDEEGNGNKQHSKNKVSSGTWSDEGNENKQRPKSKVRLGTWSNEEGNESKQRPKNKVSLGTWSDEEGNENKQRPKIKVSSGTWSDEEGDNLASETAWGNVVDDKERNITAFKNTHVSTWSNQEIDSTKKYPPTNRISDLEENEKITELDFQKSKNSCNSQSRSVGIYKEDKEKQENNGDLKKNKKNSTMRTLPPELQFCNLPKEEKDKYPISDKLLIIAQYGPPYEKFVADQLALHGYQGKDDTVFTENKAVEKSGEKNDCDTMNESSSKVEPLHSLAKNSHSSPILEINLCTSDESTGAEDNDTAEENQQTNNANSNSN